MKRQTVLGQAFLVVALVLAGCGRDGSPGNVPSVQSPPPPTSDTSSQTGRPDLIITGATVERQQGATYLSVTVKNIGQALATGLSGTCSYRCPAAGIYVTGQSFLQGGYLVPGANSYGLLPVTPSCTPDAVVRFECTVDPDNQCAETNEHNNGWIQELKIR